MRLAGYEVEALSIGGIETCIQLPELDLAFDIGRCPHSAVKRRRLLVTHTHMDHAGGLAYHAATRDLYKMKPPTWYVPRENVDDLHAMLDAFRRLDRSDLPVTIEACSPGDVVELGRGWVARPFRSPHRVACQGYALCRRRTRLREEFQGLPQAEIRDRRLAGEEVGVVSESVEIAFTGDTLPEVIEREPLVREARLLILECTFLDDRVPVEKARGSGHVHLDELLPRLPQLACESLLLTHFSARYSDEQITSILQKRLPASFRERAVPLLAGRGDL
jgi:ribonuclease Z